MNPLASISASVLLAAATFTGCAGSAPTRANEEKPATGPVPQKVLDDCLADLRAHIPGRSMKVIRSTRGEASFIVDVQVEGVPKLWRCFHDGTRVTGTEYQGEG